MINTENFTSFYNTTSSSPQCPSYIQNKVIIALNTVDWTLALPSVSWALWLLIRGSQNTLATEFFILNLLCMDMACVLLGLCSYLNEALWHSQILDSYGEFMFFLGLYGNPMIQCCVCVERYLAVVHPVTFLKVRAVRYKVATLILVWPVILAFSSANLFVHDPHILLAYLLPVACIEMFCSLSILRVLKNTGPGDELKKKERERNNTAKIRALIIVCILQIKQLVNYMPYVILTLIKGAIPKVLYACYLYSTAIYICLFGNFIQSFLYLQRTGRLSFIPLFRS